MDSIDLRTIPSNRLQKNRRELPFTVRDYGGGHADAENRELPFMANESSGLVRLNSSKVIEALIVGIFTTLMIYLLAIPKLEEKIVALSDDVNRVSGEVRDVKSEIRDIRSDIYVPAHRAEGIKR